jgi:hypothetical protein
MSPDFFSKLRSGTRSRRNRPGSRCDTTICLALLPPDRIQHISPTNLEHVSGGCWSEDQQTAPINPSNCCEVVDTRSSFQIWRDAEGLDHDRHNRLTSDITLGHSVPKRDRGVLDSRCSHTSKPGLHSFSPSKPDSHALLDRIRVGSEEEDAYGRALQIASVDESEDAISVTASSTILDPTQMPRITSGEMIAGEDSDRGSLKTGSGYSIEADEMIELKSQHSKRHTWKNFRHAWHNVQSKRGWKGQKAVPSRFSFIT